MATETFRKESLDKLATPEQLDQLMQVTTPRGWMALMAFGGLLLAVLMWGIFGKIPSRVSGQGILIKSGGVFEIESLSDGQIIDMMVDIGDRVTKGQAVVTIARPDLKEVLDNAREALADQTKSHERLVEAANANIELKRQFTFNKQTTLSNALQFAEGHLKWLNQKVTNQLGLVEQGLITRQEVTDTRIQIGQVESEIGDCMDQMEQLSIELYEFEDQKERDVLESSHALATEQRNVETMESDYKTKTTVLSPYTGRILEISADAGRAVNRGDCLMSLELDDETNSTLMIVAYVAARDGKKVQKGMKAKISPSTVKQEEYGFLLGTMTSVSEFPSTTEGMMQTLQNENLVESFSMGEAMIQMFASLTPDPKTVSGYKWSSPKGPPLKLQSGTICTISITVSEQRPIALVIPILKKAIMGEDAL